MDHHEVLWTTRDGISLYGQGWLPTSRSALGAVLLVHGMGEHGGPPRRIARCSNGDRQVSRQATRRRSR